MEKNDLSDLLDQLFLQAKMLYGPTVRRRWLHDRDECPGCGGAINVVKFKKKKAMSINVFFYRDHGVLIAYMLCNKCANVVMSESKENPHGKLPIHDEIEKNLKHAYVKHLGH